MRVLKITILLITLMICRAGLATPQQPQTGKCVIAGRVTVGDTPVRDAMVIAVLENPNPRQREMALGFTDKFTFRIKTDAEGRYRLADLNSGIYQVQVAAPALVNREKPTEELMSGMRGRRIRLADDEDQEDVNFSLVRGGVITGRVTFADGRPMIAEYIVLILETRKEMGVVRFSNGDRPIETDDRGIYRIYGIPDGRYKVCVGIEGAGFSANRRNHEKHKQTFYPGVTDEAAAQLIEIKNGNEVRDIDIKVSAVEKAYTVAGKVVDADSGQALSDFMLSLNVLHKNEDGSLSPRTTHWSQTNSKGEFKLDGVVTGAYAASANQITDPKSYYSEATRFEVNGANVSGLEIKAHRGLTVSGMVSIQGTNDPEAISELSQVMVFSSTVMLQKDREDGFAGSNSPVVRLTGDGSFSLSGLRPGKLRIWARSLSEPANLAFLRLERNGLDVSQGFELKGGEPVTDLRVVLVQANSKIRGQVKVEGGKLFKTQENWLTAVRLSGVADANSQLTSFSAELDPNGRFLLQGLLEGEYELTINVKIKAAGSSDAEDNEDDERPADDSLYRTVKQRVSVVNGQETEVTLVVKAREKND